MNTYIFISDIEYGIEEYYTSFVQAKSQQEALSLWESQDESHTAEKVTEIIELSGTPSITQTTNFQSDHSSYPEIKIKIQ